MSVALRPSHLASLSPAAPHPAPILLAHPRRAGHVLPAPSERVRGQARREENSCPSSTATSRHWQRGRPCTPSRLCPATDRVRRHGNRWSNRETRRSQTECTCPPFARRSATGVGLQSGRATGTRLGAGLQPTHRPRSSDRQCYPRPPMARACLGQFGPTERGSSGELVSVTRDRTWI